MKPSYLSFLKVPWALILIIFLTFCIFPTSAWSQPGNLPARTEEVVGAIETATADLLEDIKNEKYCRLACNSFPFYRATNYLFWNDFFQDNRLNQFGNEKTKTWITADQHVDNFGTYNNDEEEVVFDLNDFDESVVADYQYDVWRMATSIVLAVSDSQPTSLSPEKTKDIEDLIDEFSESYLDTLADYDGNDRETKTYFTSQNTDGKVKELLEYAEGKSRKKLLKKWTDKENGKRRFESPEKRDKIGHASQEEKAAIQSQIKPYGKTLKGKIKDSDNYFKVKDIAKRLKAGLGSLGTPRYYVLIDGESDSSKDDRILDVKRQSKPTPYQFFTQSEKVAYDQLFENDAQRHEVAYLALTKHTDDYLGWMYLSDPEGQFSGYYSVREVSPNKAAFDDLKDENGNEFSLANAEQSDLLSIAKQWGKILATAHARSDQDFDEKYVPYSFEKQVTKITDGKHKEFRRLVREVAFDYAKQVQADYGSFVQKLKPKDCPKCE